jgi:hypothetical protein
MDVGAKGAKPRCVPAQKPVLAAKWVKVWVGFARYTQGSAGVELPAISRFAQPDPSSIIAN